MAKLHWYCQYNTHIVDKESGEDVSNYALSFSDKTISNIFMSNEYGTDLNNVELNIKSIEDADSYLYLYASGEYTFEESDVQFFPLMDENDKEAVYNGEIYRGTKIISIGVDVTLDGYEPYSSKPDAKSDQQSLLFQWSYEDLNGGDGTFDDPPEIENDIQMSPAPLPAPPTWAWIRYTDIDFYGIRQTPITQTYPINHVYGHPFYNKFVVFSGSNSYGIWSWLNTANTSQQSHFSYQSSSGISYSVSDDPNHNYGPLNFWQLSNNEIYSAVTSETFYYSGSSHGHQSNVFSGTYHIYCVCVVNLSSQTIYDVSDVYNHPQAPINNCSLLQNEFQLDVVSLVTQCSGVSMVDVGLGYAGSAVTGKHGYVRLISSSTTYYNGMPAFISRIGSPGTFTEVHPKGYINYPAVLNTTGEVASKQRARSLWALFDDSSALDTNGKIGFTPDYIDGTGVQSYLTYDSGPFQDDNRMILTSEMLSYYGTNNYYVDELNGTNQTYLNYSVQDNTIYLNNNVEYNLGQIKLSGNTTYIIGCPTIFTTSGFSSFNITFRVGTNNSSFQTQHFFRSGWWNRNQNQYSNNPSNGTYTPIVLGAMLVKTPDFPGVAFFNIYCMANTTNYTTLNPIKIFSHQIFYHPIVRDNYLDVNGVVPIDTDDM